jgi:hypothetical protein
MEKKSGSGMNIPDNFSENLETVLGLKILKFFEADADPGSGIFSTLNLVPYPKWKNSNPGSRILSLNNLGNLVGAPFTSPTYVQIAQNLIRKDDRRDSLYCTVNKIEDL